jgi:hypothetical protein
MTDFVRTGLEITTAAGDFQADDEGSIPFTRSNVFNGLVPAAVTGAKLVAAPLGHGRACHGHPDHRALCHPDRDRRDKPGDDATSFAPVTRRRFHSDNPAVAHSNNCPPFVRAARLVLAPSRPVSWFAWRTRHLQRRAALFRHGALTNNVSPLRGLISGSCRRCCHCLPRWPLRRIEVGGLDKAHQRSER